VNKTEIIKKIREAGVVGAGGGGFPAHVKMQAESGVLIANGAECEPLLSTDRSLMEKRSSEIIEGLRIAAQATGAESIYIALKKKYEKAVSEIKKHVGKTSEIEIFLLDDYYPAGDEFEIVYNITGKVIPEGGIPPDVGAVVANVNTLLNIKAAMEGKSVAARWVTVAGAVREPYIAEVPVGVSASELIKKASPLIEDYVIIAGGPMTGKVVSGDFRITKTCGGILVLPPGNPVAVKKTLTFTAHSRRGRSMCDQCFDCTIVCPRHLLGHDLEPHKVMRSLFVAPENSKEHITNTYLCCECGLCSMFACPLELSPKDMIVNIKEELKRNGINNPHGRKDLNVHPERDFRRVSSKRLMARLGIERYEMKEFQEKKIKAKTVRVPLQQHIGLPAKPVVKTGDSVKAGAVIAEIPEGKLGARVHASIDGKVNKIEKDFVEIIG